MIVDWIVIGVIVESILLIPILVYGGYQLYKGAYKDEQTKIPITNLRR